MDLNSGDSYFIVIDGIFVAVGGDAQKHFEDDTLEKDYAYVHEGQCYIYGGKLKEKIKHGYFYKNSGKLVFVPANDPEMSSVNNIKNVTMIKREMVDRTNFKDQTEDIDLTDPKVFAPPIKEEDDPLKKIVKMALQELQIDMREYYGKFDKDYDMSNLKGSLTKPNPLSMKYFLRWCEVLDLHCDIAVRSRSSRAKHALKKEIGISIE